MKKMSFTEAIEDALIQAMTDDPHIIIMGEDVQVFRLNLFVRFGERRILNVPISEAAFVGAAVGAAMAGLKPVVEVMLVDFIGPAIDALLNQASKVWRFSGERWNVPLVVRAACGGGYGDGGQHEQSLWGWLAHIPGLSVVVPSNPADAGGLMISAIAHEGPVVYLEHKMLSEMWLDYMGIGGRESIQFDVPPEGASGMVPDRWKPLPIGKAKVLRMGKDLTLVSLGLSVHRCLEASDILKKKGISAGVIDLRSVSPMDKETVLEAVSMTGRMLVVDEDYKDFGLSGEMAAVALEAGLSLKYSRVCTEDTIPYSRELEDQALPGTERIVESSLQLVKN